MNFANLLSSTNSALLLAGLAVLALSIVVSTLRVWRGHNRAGVINIILALVACVLIATSLVRITFPVLAGASPDSTSDTAMNTAGSGPKQPPLVQTALASGLVPARAQTQITEGTIPPRLQTAVASGSVPAQSGNILASIGGNPSGGVTAPNQTGQDSGAAPQIPVSGNPIDRVLILVTIAGAVVTVLAGIMLFLIERRRAEFNPSASPGLLYVGVGIFVLVTALVVPVLPGQFTLASARAQSQANVPTDGPLPTRGALASATPSVTLTPSSTPTVIPSLTPAPNESPTGMFTAIAYEHSGVNTPSTTCNITAPQQTNLRADPSVRLQAIGKVFAGSLLQVTGRTEDSKWWRVLYTSGSTTIEGWVSAEFVKTVTACADGSVPVIVPTRTPSRTPTLTRTVPPSRTPRPSATPKA
jgi:uncharacterized protein YraI